MPTTVHYEVYMLFPGVYRSLSILSMDRNSRLKLFVYIGRIAQRMHTRLFAAAWSFLSVSILALKGLQHGSGHKRWITRQSLKHALSPRAERMFETISLGDQVGGAGGSSSKEGLFNLDKAWFNLRNGGWRNKAPPIVFFSSDKVEVPASDTVYDVSVCGGTLGIFYAYSLQLLGYKTCVIERGTVSGRPQEWNISRKELKVLVNLRLLTAEEMQSVIGIEFNPVRAGFKTDTSPESTDPGFEVYVEDILNLGVRPNKLIALLRQKYIDAGGVVLENAKLSRIDVYENMASLSLETSEKGNIYARLVLDAMGNGSPIVKQIRGPVEPDGICIVVGGCARGFDAGNNTYSDVIYTDTPITRKNSSSLQYFWEAFPAGSGPTDRTTYLFTYMDAKPERPSILEVALLFSSLPFVFITFLCLLFHT